MTSLYRIHWVLRQTIFGGIWQPSKPKYGNYRLRGSNSRLRKHNLRIIKKISIRQVDLSKLKTLFTYE